MSARGRSVLINDSGTSNRQVALQRRLQSGMMAGGLAGDLNLILKATVAQLESKQTSE